MDVLIISDSVVGFGEKEVLRKIDMVDIKVVIKEQVDEVGRLLYFLNF